MSDPALKVDISGELKPSVKQSADATIIQIDRVTKAEQAAAGRRSATQQQASTDWERENRRVKERYERSLVEELRAERAAAAEIKRVRAERYGGPSAFERDVESPFMRNLKREAETLGMSKRQLREYAASHELVTTEARKLASAHNAKIAAYERTQAVMRTLTRVGVGLGLSFGAVALAGLAVVRNNIELADSVGLLSERFGASAEDLSSVRLGLAETGTSMHSYARGVQFLSQQMLAANSGNKAAQAHFRALGVEWADATGKLRPLNDVIEDVADAFAQHANGAGKAGLAAKLFGETAGPDMVAYLNKGGEGIRASRRELEGWGGQVSGESARAAREFKANLSALQVSAAALGRELADNTVKALVGITREMREARKEGGLLATMLAGLRKGAQYMAGVGSNEQERDNAIEQMTRREREIARLREQNIRGNAGQIAQLEREVAHFRAVRDRAQVGLSVTLGGDALGEFGGSRAAKPTLDDATRESTTGSGGSGGGGARRGPTAAEKAEQEAQRRAQAAAELESRAALFIAGRRQADTDAATAMHDALTREAQAVIDTIDPWSRYNKEMERFRVLREAGLLTEEQFGAAMEQASERAANGLQTLGETGVDTFTELKNAMDGWGRDASRTFARAAVDGELSFKTLGDAARNFLSELLAIQVQRQFMDPALKAGTQFLSNLFAPTSALPRPGVDFYIGDELHTGGIAGLEGRARMVHSAHFVGAPRLHSGGIMPGERPAILREGEGVFTPGQMRAMGAPRVTVQVINQSGQPVQAEQAGAPRFDGEGYVVGVVLRDLVKGGPIRSMVQTIQGPVN